MSSLLTRIYIQSTSCVITFEFLLNGQILDIDKALDVFEGVNSKEKGSPWGYRRVGQEIHVYTSNITYTFYLNETAMSMKECDPKNLLHWMPGPIVRQFLKEGEQIPVFFGEDKEMSLISLLNS